MWWGRWAAVGHINSGLTGLICVCMCECVCVWRLKAVSCNIERQRDCGGRPAAWFPVFGLISDQVFRGSTIFNWLPVVYTQWKTHSLTSTPQCRSWNTGAGKCSFATLIFSVSPTETKCFITNLVSCLRRQLFFHRLSQTQSLFLKVGNLIMLPPKKYYPTTEAESHVSFVEKTIPGCIATVQREITFKIVIKIV